MAKLSKHFFDLVSELQDERYNQLEMDVFESQDHQCSCCGKVDKLVLHNTIEFSFLKAWEYPKELSIGLCFDCFCKNNKI